MAFTFTPGQFTHRAELYHQLGQLTAAGLGLLPALQQLERTPPTRSFRQPLRKLLDELTKGYSFAESLKSTGTWAPAFDVALLEAGENSGRLDASFRLLADYYSDRARLTKQLLADLAYPVFLFHFAILVLPFPQLFLTGNVRVYLTTVLSVLVPIYAVVFFIVFAMQSRHGEGWRSFIEALLRAVPILGTARRWLALSRLTASLEGLLSAGVNIVEAWELAATASGSPALRRAVHAWKPDLQAGKTPAEMVTGSRVFPELFANQYATGELSGKLEDTVGRLHRYYQGEGVRKMQAVAQWVPRLIYLTIVFFIAYKILTFWTGYFQQVQNVTGGF